jgi:hypothetical protein
MIAIVMDTPDSSRRPEHALSERQACVLAVLEDMGPLHDEQIRARLGWRINQVCPRRHELVTKGLVERAGTVFNGETHRRVVVWRAVARPALPE